MASNDMSVNVGTRFLPHFSPLFVDRYGPAFAHATSDIFTLALAKLMDRAGLLLDPSDIARFSDDESVDLLGSLVKTLGDRKKVLLGEACGTLPVGAFAQAADDCLGEGAFQAWLGAFRSRDRERCLAILEAANR